MANDRRIDIKLTIQNDQKIQVAFDPASFCVINIDGDEFKLRYAESLDGKKNIDVISRNFRQIPLGRKEGKARNHVEILSAEVVASSPFEENTGENADQIFFTARKKNFKCIKCNGLYWCVRGGSILTPCGWVHNSKFALS